MRFQAACDLLLTTSLLACASRDCSEVDGNVVSEKVTSGVLHPEQSLHFATSELKHIAPISADIVEKVFTGGKNGWIV